MEKFPTSWDKILYARGLLQGDIGEAWYQHQTDLAMDEDHTTWEEFIEFLKDETKLMAIWHMDALWQYHSVKQQEGQSVQKFVAYLDTLETELEDTPSENTRRDHLYLGLDPAIIERLEIAPVEYKLRRELISAAIIAEAQMCWTRQKPTRPSQVVQGERQALLGSYHKCKPGPDKYCNLPAHLQSSQSLAGPMGLSPPNHQPLGAPGIHPGPTGADRHQDQSLQSGSVICFNCNKPGHIAPKCPKPKRLKKDPGATVGALLTQD